MGAFSLRLPSYLVRNDYSYCFRVIVPPDLQAVVHRREIRYSLHTGTLGEAKYRALRMAGFVQTLFRKLRFRGESMSQQLTDAEIKKLLDGYLKTALEDAEKFRVTAQKPLMTIQLMSGKVEGRRNRANPQVERPGGHSQLAGGTSPHFERKSLWCHPGQPIHFQDNPP
jgi:hypothetical protein